MKSLRVMSMAPLVLLFGTFVQVYGQQEKRDEKQQGQHAQQPQQQAQPQQRQQQSQRNQGLGNQQQRAQYQQPAQQGNPNGQQRSYAPPQRTQQQAQVWQQQSGWRQQGGWQGHDTWQQDRSSNWQSDHRTWEQRGGYGGYYIPEDRFSLYFGNDHWFRIHSRPTIVGGYPRFQADGFWFMMVDPYPQAWPEDWYATDDVYVGYNDGYYLYNRRDPGVGIALTVVL